MEKESSSANTVQNVNDAGDDSLTRMCAMIRAVEMSSKFIFGKCIGNISDNISDSTCEYQSNDDARTNAEDDGISDEDDEEDRDDRVMNDDPTQSQQMTMQLYHDIFDGIMIDRNLEVKMPMWAKSQTDENGLLMRLSEAIHPSLTMAIPMCSKRKHCHVQQARIPIVDIEIGEFKNSMRHLYDVHSKFLNPSWTRGTKSRYIDIGIPSNSDGALDFARDVALTWSQHLFPRRVTVIPRRIFLLSSTENIDASHIHSNNTTSGIRRIGNRKPIGIFLVGLGYNHRLETDFKPFLTLKFSLDDDDEKIVPWRWDEGSWIGFYNDVTMNIVTTSTTHHSTGDTRHNPAETGNIGAFISFDIYVSEDGETSPFDDEPQEDYYLSMQPPRKVPKLGEGDKFSPSNQQFTSAYEEAGMYFNAERCMVVNHLSAVQRPFGFLIGHQYSLQGIVSPSRADVELLIHLLSRIPNTDTVLLAVTTFVDREESSSSLVRPPTPTVRIAAFTPAHIRLLSGDTLGDENRKQIESCNRFMNRNQLIPIIPFEFDKSALLRSELVRNGDSRRYTEHSMFLQTALVVVDSIVV